CQQAARRFESGRRLRPPPCHRRGTVLERKEESRTDYVKNLEDVIPSEALFSAERVDLAQATTATWGQPRAAATTQTLDRHRRLSRRIEERQLHHLCRHILPHGFDCDLHLPLRSSQFPVQPAVSALPACDRAPAPPCPRNFPSANAPSSRNQVRTENTSAMKSAPFCCCCSPPQSATVLPRLAPHPVPASPPH